MKKGVAHSLLEISTEAKLLRKIGPNAALDNWRLAPLARKRFFKKFQKNKTGCWVWMGHKNKTGYGLFYVGKYQRCASRLSYLCHKGVIPYGLFVDHICRNTSCVNPTHLRLLTARDNTLCGESPTAKNHRKTHCKRGHSFSGYNLKGRERGWRACRECAAIHSKNYFARKKSRIERTPGPDGIDESVAVYEVQK